MSDRITTTCLDPERSALGDFVISTQQLIDHRYLIQTKIYPGIWPINWVQIRGYLATRGLTISEQTNLRRRWAKMITNYRGYQYTDGKQVGYTEIVNLLGSGKAPQSNGRPTLDPYGSGQLIAPTLYKYWQEPQGAIGGTGQTDSYSYGLTSENITFNPSGGIYPDGSFYPCVLSNAQLYDEEYFTSHLSTLAVRLQARAFTGVPWRTEDTSTEHNEWTEQENFDEYRLAFRGADTSGIDPDVYTGTAVSASPSNFESGVGLPSVLLPYIGASGTDTYHLCSFWNLGQDPSLGYGDPDVLPTMVNAQRCNFRVNVQSSYFIARGYLYNPFSSTGSSSLLLHSPVAVIEQGTLNAGVSKELPFPYYGGEGSLGWRDFVQLENVLSCGAITFCILNETPAAWSARTGISTTPTADDSVHSADSDQNTSDQ